MSRVTEYYAEFLYPGLFVAETGVARIDDPYSVKVPEHAMAYRTYARTATTIDGETLRGAGRDYSPWTYFGTAFTLAEVRQRMPDKRTLIANMEGNGYARVVRTRGGMFLPVADGDSIVEQRRRPHALSSSSGQGAE